MRINAPKYAAGASRANTRQAARDAKNAARRPAVKSAYTRTKEAARAQWSRLREAVADETIGRDDEVAVKNETPLRWKRQAVGAIEYCVRRLRDSPAPLRSFVTALLSLVPAILLTYAMRSLLGNHTFLFFLGAVVVGAATGGLWAGLLTILFALPPCLYFLSSPVSVSAGLFNILASLGLFVLMGVVTCALSDGLYAARQQAERARAQAEAMSRRSHFLAQASAILDTSHDYASVLGQVTRAIVPAYADWAAIDMVDRTGAAPTLTRMAASHRAGGAVENLLRGLRKRFPLDVGEDHPIVNALHTGKARLAEDGCALQSWLSYYAEQSAGADAAHFAEYVEALRGLTPCHALYVPLMARGKAIGVLTFAFTSPERRYTHTDLAMARDLAMRVGCAVENIRLYREAQQELLVKADMERRIREYSAILEANQLKLEEEAVSLKRQIMQDGLTGLNNHRAFQEALAHEYKRTRRYDKPLSLLLLDVDKFKQYNDTYGHPAGDQVLKQVARALRHNARDTDFVARYGGEEFVVILLDTDRAGALQMGERLRQAIESLTGLSRQVTASFGAATLTPRTATPSELIAQADQALYASKHGGRNRVTHTDALPNSGVENDADTGLGEALATNRNNAARSSLNTGLDAGLDVGATIGGIETPLIEAVVAVRARP